MKEMVTIDGKQFELMTEYPLTEQQRQQTIANIRKQSGCSSCNKTQSLGGGIQSLVSPTCVGIEILASNVAVLDVTIGGATCTPGTPPTCTPPSITCTEPNCTSITESVVARFTNVGGDIVTIIPTLTVTDSTPTATTYHLADPGTLPIPADDSIGTTATFTAVVLARGHNNVCVDFTLA